MTSMKKLKLERQGYYRYSKEKVYEILVEHFGLNVITIEKEMELEFNFENNLNEIVFQKSKILKSRPIYYNYPVNSVSHKQLPKPVEHHEVFRVIKKNLKQLNSNILSCKDNWQILINYSRYFISMEYKGYLQLSDICSNMKVVKYSDRNIDHGYYEFYNYLITYYIYYDYILPVLKHNYFWVESSKKSASVAYFTYSQWHRFVDLVRLSNQLQGNYSTQITTTQLSSLPGNYAVAHLRFIMKNHRTLHYRMISNFKAVPQTMSIVDDIPSFSNYTQPDFFYNQAKLLAFFQKLKKVCPQYLTDDMIPPNSLSAIAQYKHSISTNQSTSTSNVRVYLVRADIKACYDSLQHSLIRYSFLHLLSKLPDNIINSHEKEKRKRQLNNFLDNIYLKLSDSSSIHRLLCGIPQGATISKYLCNLALIYIKQRELYNQQILSGSIFHQYVDDLIFVSSHRQFAETFLSRIKTVYPKYGLILNDDKIIFETVNAVPWLGYQINTKCEVIWKDNKDWLDEVPSKFCGRPSNCREAVRLLRRKLQYLWMCKQRICRLNADPNNITPSDIMLDKPTNDSSDQSSAWLSRHVGMLLCRMSRTCLPSDRLKLFDTNNTQIISIFRINTFMVLLFAVLMMNAFVMEISGYYFDKRQDDYRKYLSNHLEFLGKRSFNDATRNKLFLEQ